MLNKCASQRSDLAAVTAWFNPSGSVERQAAENRFYEGWPRDIPLHPACKLAIAPIWQKERLLNLAIRQLPAHVKKVVWVDADVLVKTEYWSERISAALDEFPVIQPWATANFIGIDGTPTKGPLGSDFVTSVPCTHAWSPISPMPLPNPGLPANAWPGFAWAARREVLDEIGGLYEYDLSGPNDVLMSLAFYGDFGNSFLMRYSGRFKDHFMPWAERAYKVVNGNVGCVPATLTHLWHGPFDARRYLERTVRLYQAGYDPSRDVGTADDGTLVLTDDCPWEVRSLAAKVIGIDLPESDWSGRDCNPLADIQAAVDRAIAETGI